MKHGCRLQTATGKETMGPWLILLFLRVKPSFFIFMARWAAFVFARDGREGLMQLWESSRAFEGRLPKGSLELIPRPLPDLVDRASRTPHADPRVHETVIQKDLSDGRFHDIQKGSACQEAGAGEILLLLLGRFPQSLSAPTVVRSFPEIAQECPSLQRSLPGLTTSCLGMKTGTRRSAPRIHRPGSDASGTPI